MLGLVTGVFTLLEEPTALGAVIGGAVIAALFGCFVGYVTAIVYNHLYDK